MSNGVRRFLTLFRTEVKLTLRSLDMVIFAVIMPVVVLVVVGMIFGDGGGAVGGGEAVPGGGGAGIGAGGTIDAGSAAGEPGGTASAGMIADTFGAFLAIGICAVGLMGLPLTLAEYRHRRVLKRLQVTPVHPGLLLAVQLATQTLVAVVSALLVTIAARLFFGVDLPGSPIAVAGAFALVLVSIFSLGLMIASSARDVRRAGMIASILYFPMLLFSGTTIPFPVFPEGVQRVASILPLRHGITLLNGVARGERITAHAPEIGLLVAIAVIGILVSIRTFRWDMES
jgi:ABC-2 type transport system permease protein